MSYLGCRFHVCIHKAKILSHKRKVNAMNRAYVLFLGILLVGGTCGEAIGQTYRGASYGNQGPGSQARPQYVSPASIGWRQVVARDATFRLQLPDDWQEVGQQILEDFSAVSPRSESYGSGEVEVFANQMARDKILPSYQLILPPAKSALMARLMSSPLSPSQVVTGLFPQVAGGAMRNVRILKVQELPWLPGFSTALIFYQYLLLPRADAAYASTLPPALLSQRQVPMTAVAVISTTPGNGIAWTMTYAVLAALSWLSVKWRSSVPR
jgi:hypothetical protein